MMGLPQPPPIPVPPLWHPFKLRLWLPELEYATRVTQGPVVTITSDSTTVMWNFRALVLIFSTTIHVYNCICYGRAARIRRS